MIDFLGEQFHHFFGRKPEAYFFSPGRVNFIGEHIDYNGGRVVPFAIHRGIYAAVSYNSENENNRIRLKTHFDPQIYEFSLEEDLTKYKNRGWFQYPLGVIHMIKSSGYNLRGCDILYYSDLPSGSGLSSSAAMEVLTAYIFYLMVKSPHTIDRTHLAIQCQKVENQFIGVQCGIMDQFSVAMGKKGHFILLDTQTLDYEYLPFKFENVSIVIINSNKPRTLAGSEYNNRRDECNRALQILKEKYDIKTLVEATVDMLDILKKDSILFKRAFHVVTENQRVIAATELLKKVSVNSKEVLSKIGELLLQSHESLKNDFEVSCKELDIIVEKSQQIDGVYGARMTGAGFGGCVIAVMEKNVVNLYKENIYKDYTEKTGLEPDIFEVYIDDGVRIYD